MALTGRKLIIVRQNQARKLISVWCPAALKRDVKRIARHEGKSQSMVCAGLIRLGISRYFDDADDKKLAPLRAAMKDLFFHGEPEPKYINTHQVTPFPVKQKHRKQILLGLAAIRLAADFEAATKERTPPA